MKLKKFFVWLAVLPLLGAGCISVSSAPKQGQGGGVFKSSDRGATWVNKTALPTAKGTQSIGNADVLTFAFDPSDPKAVYIGTAGSGILYSYDGAETWQRAGGVASGRINALAVHPEDKCTIFAALGNRLIKSSDCNRSYEIVYTDPRSEAQITSVIIDWFKPSRIYIATLSGDLQKSEDGGASWSPVNHWDDGIAGVIMSKGDSRKIWVATKTQGLSLSEDGGINWQDLRKTMDEFDGARAFQALAEDRSVAGTLIHASRFGLLKSADSGKTWQKMNILTPPQAVTITALAVNPSNGADIYYTTQTKIYKSKDSGASWSTADLPTARQASALAVDPMDGNAVYLGVSQPKK
jgi:photosystem II stability/assembly factor-like uncharacterized protein